MLTSRIISGDTRRNLITLVSMYVPMLKIIKYCYLYRHINHKYKENRLNIIKKLCQQQPENKNLLRT